MIYCICDLNDRMGTRQKNYEQLAQEVEMYTGGMSVGPHIVNHHSELDRFELVCSTQ